MNQQTFVRDTYWKKRDIFLAGAFYKARAPLEIVHTDLYGPMRTKGLNGELYFLLFIDDYTRMTCVFFLRKK